MKHLTHLALGLATASILGVATTALAQPTPMGPGMMMHGMGSSMGPGMMHSGGDGEFGGPMGMHHADASFGADMQLVHAMLLNHDKIKRTVTNLPDGIRTVTQSEDPEAAQAIKAHVASMEKRLGEGKEFNLFSPTIPVLFENRDKIKTAVVTTEKGTIVTQTSSDDTVVAALQAHAAEVSELARDGMVAMMRAMRANMMSRASR